MALNTSPVPDGENVPNLEVDKAATVGKILEQIQKRLKGGLARVWEGPNGHDIEWEVVQNPSGDPNADLSGPSEQLAAEETRLVAAIDLMRRVVAECLANNAASARVLEKAGFQRSGERDDLLLWELPPGAVVQ